jgi:RES domain-containing protein
LDSSDLYQALASLGTIRFEGRVYRHVAPQFDCRSGEGASVRGGRWNPPNSFPTLYTALSLDTAAAELKRLASNQRILLDSLLPRKVCVMRVKLLGVVDLRSENALNAVGLRSSDVGADDLSRCRTVGEAIQKYGSEGILAPSAANAGFVLVVFPSNLGRRSRLESIEAFEWASEADLG